MVNITIDTGVTTLVTVYEVDAALQQQRHRVHAIVRKRLDRHLARAEQRACAPGTLVVNAELAGTRHRIEVRARRQSFRKDQNRHRRALGREPRHRAAAAKHFVVGVSCHNQDVCH